MSSFLVKNTVLFGNSEKWKIVNFWSVKPFVSKSMRADRKTIEKAGKHPITVQSLNRLGRRLGGARRGGVEQLFNRDPLQVASVGGHCQQFWHWQGRPLFDVVHPAFPPPTQKDGFGETVIVFDMPELCKFPSLESCQKRFL